MRGMVVSLSAEPSAHGATTSHSISKMRSSGTISALNSRCAR
jgi:hypothetical protein